MTTRLLVLLAALAAPTSAAAQIQVPSWLNVDSVTAVDRPLVNGGTANTGLIADAVVSAQVGRSVQLYTRPFVQRLPSGEWNKQVWLAAARYERKGDIGVRVDAGLIPPPTGFANLTLRPHLNPLISLPASLFQGLPAVEPRAPRTTLLGALYPYGVSTTVSGTRWDVRAALIDTSPVRTRRVFASGANPPRFRNVAVGGGITPVVGLRIGASVTRGGWKRADEAPLSSQTLDATVITVESEFAFRFTHLVGEWTQDRFETTGGRAVATGWYLQGQHALTPRVFVAGRVERIGAPASTPSLAPERAPFVGSEQTVGYRLTRDVTFRVSHRVRRPFNQPAYTSQMLASLVLARQWF